MRQLKPGYVVAGAIMLAACAGPPVDDQPLAEIALSPYVGRLVTAEVSIDGHSGTFLFDTGGGITMVTPEFAARIGCEPWGQTISFRMSGEQVASQNCGTHELTVGGARLVDDIGAFDLMALLPEGLPPLDGVLSLKTFDGGAITLNLADSVLILESQASLSRRIGDAPGVPLRIMRESAGAGLTIFLPVETTPGPLWFLVDSANLGPALYAPHTRDLLQRAGALNAEGDAIQFSWGEGAPIESHAAEAAIIYDGAVNEATLHRTRLTLDLENGHAWSHPSELRQSPQGE